MAVSAEVGAEAEEVAGGAPAPAATPAPVLERAWEGVAGRSEAEDDDEEEELGVGVDVPVCVGVDVPDANCSWNRLAPLAPGSEAPPLLLLLLAETCFNAALDMA